MADALLHACRLTQRVYSLAGPFTYGSIRDSMWRAQTLLERLFINGRIRRGSKILIVGGGISGMQAAISAVALGAGVTLVERSERLASRQANCFTRSICPTTFDFPFSHWNEGEYPIAGDRVKIPWRRNVASDAQLEWIHAFSDFLKFRTHRIRIHLSTRISSFSTDTTGILATLQVLDRRGQVTKEHSDRYDLAIFCTGPGEEMCGVPSCDFAGYGFWDSRDPLFSIQGSNGAKELAGQAILIVGGGDGGLWDFVSLLTDIPQMADIVNDIGFTDSDRDDIHRIRLTLNANFQIGCEKTEHRIFLKVQEESLRLVDEMWRRGAIRQKVRLMLRPLRERPAVQIVMPCYHFRFGYVINRVVAQLFARALAEDLDNTNKGLPPFRVGAKVVRVDGDKGHLCRGNKQDCTDHWHVAHFAKRACQGVRAVPAFVQERRVDVGKITRKWPRRTVTLSTEPLQCRRILFRIGAAPHPDYLRQNYGVSRWLAKELTNRPLFRLVNPFYPI